MKEFLVRSPGVKLPSVRAAPRRPLLVLRARQVPLVDVGSAGRAVRDRVLDGGDRAEFGEGLRRVLRVQR